MRILRWAVEFRSDCTHFVFRNCNPLLFRTRREARQFAKDEYGYIADRPDLRKPPFNWKTARVVRVSVSIREAKS